MCPRVITTIHDDVIAGERFRLSAQMRQKYGALCCSMNTLNKQSSAIGFRRDDVHVTSL